MIADDNYEDMRMGLEYISRKKLVLPIPNTFTRWPVLNNKGDGEAGDAGDGDSDDELDINMIVNDGDPCWFLWAMLFCVYPNNKNVATNFKLFCQNWRKNAKVERVGLLWGIPFLIDDYSDLIWTADDKEIFEKVKMNTNELWTYTVNEHQRKEQKSDKRSNGSNNGNGNSNRKTVEVNDDKHKDFYNEHTNIQSDHQNKLALFGSFIPRKVATLTLHDSCNGINGYNQNITDHYDHLVESINTGATTKTVRVQNKLIPNDQKKPNMSVNKIDNSSY
jgi:hypothetical protein